ncbi:unnamed protein product [Ambrosiozyma monospora]|uniref:Unnamed protein product n=1 Tax=Ambrosiozyma monospora TaxID=43982 RepID=A0ACB5SYC6_AMBMO|nr:unnamed protein product [Ambrosiozyma monospora]
MLQDIDFSEIPQSWLILAQKVSENPSDFPAWQELIEHTETLPSTTPRKKVRLTKYSNKHHIKLLFITYENLLIQFPYLEQYWVNFAEWKWKLDPETDISDDDDNGDYTTADDIYKRALSIIPSSIVIWEAYIDYAFNVKNTTEHIFHIFQDAITEVGYHFYSHTIYDKFLDFLKKHDMSKYYHLLLRRIIEIPLYHYSKYFKLWLHLIDTADLTTIKYMITQPDLKKYYKLKYRDLIKDETFKTLKISLRKTFLDVYITTQFNVFQMFNFEKKLETPYFEPNAELTRDELNNWNSYLQYIELVTLKKNQPVSEFLGQVFEL